MFIKYVMRITITIILIDIMIIFQLLYLLP